MKMKIPSIIKIPRHQRFHIEPRYYDPIKEEVENRERLIIAEINAEKNNGTYVPGSRISRGFGKLKPTKDDSAILRIAIAALLFGGTVGYLYFGMWAVYTVFGLGISFYIVKRLKLL